MPDRPGRMPRPTLPASSLTQATPSPRVRSGRRGCRRRSFRPSTPRSPSLAVRVRRGLPLRRCALRPPGQVQCRGGRMSTDTVDDLRTAWLATISRCRSRRRAVARGGAARPAVALAGRGHGVLAGVEFGLRPAWPRIGSHREARSGTCSPVCTPLSTTRTGPPFWPLGSVGGWARPRTGCGVPGKWRTWSRPGTSRRRSPGWTWSLPGSRSAVAGSSVRWRH